ncbi:hypothetical protein EDD30_3700 [Couchioplanes caeruleus]|uniref:(2Fe-2S) ferredoxin domain-containing protein n=1 Tax=Couchioplanes caeruleus TaxID=56438 RepID=A0A3N1GL50_9ACTN|nr:hypothetical protein EDD30_3700 [Couchioplanes caeruleus]
MADEDMPGCTLTVCRDCCCGSRVKHPAVDHAAQVDRLRELLPAAHRVRTSLCLDVCAQSNVMVVQPARTARRQGARPVWFGLVLDDAIVTDIADWVRAGGPGVAGLPATLALSVIPAPAAAGER